MNRILRYSLSAVVLAALCTGVMLLRARALEVHHEIACNRLEISLSDSVHFAGRTEVKDFIESGYAQCIGMRIEDIDLARIEEMMCSRSYVQACQAWVTDDGVLHVDILNREPVILFKNSTGSFYADSQGYFFPVLGEPMENVRTIDGDVSHAFDLDFMNTLMHVFKTIETDKFWSGRLSHYSITANGDFVITDKDGLLVLLGNGKDISQALSRAEKYYSSIKPRKEEGYYKSINVKYKNQIICRQDTQLQ